MTTHAKHGIIFDCDGTLVNSLGQALHSFNHGLAMIGEAPRTIEEIKRHFGAAADRIFLALLGDEKKALAAFEHYLDHQSELAKTTKLHEGVRELLDQLRAEGVPMAIVTGRHARDLEVVLGPHALHDYFVTLVADSQLPKSKPAPDGILLAAQRMGLDPQNTFYVGDSASDIQAARNAGAVGVAALWDELAHEKEMQAAGAELLVRRPAEVRELFHRRFL